MNQELSSRLEACERANRRLTRIVISMVVSGTIAVAALVTTHANAANPAAQSMRVSELVVVDQKGVERVRISGNVPDAVIHGKRVARGEDAAGIILYDNMGQERSGYLTFDKSGNAGLMLDTRNEQIAYLVADAEDGAALRLRKNNDWFEIRAGDDTVHLNGVRNRVVTFQQPPMSRAAQKKVCVDLKNTRLGPDQMKAACRERMTEYPCRACMTDKEK